jgi:sensor histidine kinase regulating citrate/malate metabolism
MSLGKFGLRAKIVLMVTGVTLLAIGTISVSTGYVFGREYAKALKSRSLAISQSLKIQLERVLQLGIKLDHLTGFEEQCSDAVQSYSGISYALVAAPNGHVLFHSDRGRTGNVLSDPAVLHALRSSDQTGTTVFETAASGYSAVVPVLSQTGEHLASVAVGFPANLIAHQVNQMLRSDRWRVAVAGGAVRLRDQTIDKLDRGHRTPAGVHRLFVAGARTGNGRGGQPGQRLQSHAGPDRAARYAAAARQGRG